MGWKKTLSIALLIFLGLSAAWCIDLNLQASGVVPLGRESAYYKTGLDLEASAMVPLFSGIGAEASLLCGLYPLVSGPYLSSYTMILRPSYTHSFSSAFSMKFAAGLGFYFANFLGAQDFPELQDLSGTGVSLDAGLEVQFALNRHLSIGVNGAYRTKSGLHGGLSAGVSGIWRPDFSLRGKEESAIESGGGFFLEGIELESVFPIFYKYYHENSFGTCRVINQFSEPVSEVDVTFYLQQYMAAPQVLARIDTLAPGESRSIP